MTPVLFLSLTVHAPFSVFFNKKAHARTGCVAFSNSPARLVYVTSALEKCCPELNS